MALSNILAKKFFPAVASIGLGALVLTGCATVPQNNLSKDDCVAPGSLSELVTTVGDFGKFEGIDYPKSFIASEMQRSVYDLESTDSSLQVEVNRPLELRYAIFAAKNGALLEQGGFAQNVDPLLTSITETSAPLLSGALLCMTAGQRSVTVAPISSLTQSETEGIFGLEASDTLIMVAEITKVYPEQATGFEKNVPFGFPQVVFADTGQPGLTLIDAESPTELKVAVIKEGLGEEIVSGDQLIVKYTNWLWQKPLRVNYSTWNSGLPEVLIMGSESSPNAVAINEAFIGKKIGSRVMIVVPPSGEAGAPTSALIYVMDVLGKR